MREITTHIPQGLTDYSHEPQLTINQLAFEHEQASGLPVLYRISFSPKILASEPEAAKRIVSHDLIFQFGDPAEVGTKGITIESLLAVSADRLEQFQAGSYPHACNDKAIYHIKMAMEALHERARQVEQEKKNVRDHVIDFPAKKFVPVWRPESSHHFVTIFDAAIKQVDVQGESVMTAPLKFGKPVDLIGISYSHELAARGAIDVTDNIGQIKLENIYLYFKNTGLSGDVQEQLVKLPLKDPLRFTTHPGDGYRSKSIKKSIEFDLCKVDPLTLPAFIADSLSLFSSVTFWCHVTGTVQQELGSTLLHVGGATVKSLITKEGKDVTFDQDHAPARYLLSRFEYADYLGYDLDAERANPNSEPMKKVLNGSPA